MEAGCCWRAAMLFPSDGAESPMADPADALVLDFVAWTGRGPRLYSEVIATWRTSCPRLTIWEDAVDRGYVERETVAGFGLIVTVTEHGERLLRERCRGVCPARVS